MFTQSLPASAPAPSSPGLHASSPTSPARTSRLRGLSYLRSYTQNHILNREPHAAAVTVSANSSGSALPAETSPSSPSPSPLSAAANGIAQPAGSSTVPSAVPCPIHSPSFTAANAALPAPAPATASLVPSPSPPLTSEAVRLVASPPPPPAPVSPVPSRARSSTNPVRPPARNPAGTPPSASAITTVSSLQAYRTGLTSLTAAETPAAVMTASAVASALSPASSSLAASAATSTLEPSSTATNPGSAHAMTRSRSATEPAASTPAATTATTATAAENLPSIRFSTFYDPRSNRPSLKFSPMSRTLPTGKEVIRVGRYSERDSQPNSTPNTPSAAHVGFKSKVVSRRHCEFWYENNRWFIKDVKSSSGTFLNHIRLSQPGTESKPFPVNDGDIIQLGIDFKGGEEMIFRCVKMRVELNRGWQSKLNAFNLNTHKRLRNMTKVNEDSGSTQSSQDCSICLNSIAPCQSLFVAPCSHTWHYKCIRALLESPQYPNFICPNCRAAVDLEADVEDPPDEWEHMDLEDAMLNDAVDEASVNQPPSRTGEELPSSYQQANSSGPSLQAPSEQPQENADMTMHVDSVMDDIEPVPAPRCSEEQQQPEQRGVMEGCSHQPEQDCDQDRDQGDVEHHVSHSTVHPVAIPTPNSVSRFPLASTAVINSALGMASLQTRTPSPTERHVTPSTNEGPITPRNDAGPWVFDGSGIRIGSSRASTDSHRGEIRSLDTATAEMAGQFTSR